MLQHSLGIAGFGLLALLHLDSCHSSKSTTTSDVAPMATAGTTTVPQPQTVPAKDAASNKQPVMAYLKDSISIVSINLVGDMMTHMPQVKNADKGNGVYDFVPCFEYVQDYLSGSDFTIGNLETTFAGSSLPYHGYPSFNSPDDYCKSLKDVGFDFMVTSNNHSMDTGEEGLLRTLTILQQNGLGSTGTFRSQADHDSLRMITIRGLRLGIINYTYGSNGAYPIAAHRYMLNIIDSASITQDVKRLQKMGADMVLVFYHMGVENMAEPNAQQKDAVRYAWYAGAQLIIGAHPHVVGPTKELGPVNGHVDSSFVAYSLGNFLSNQYWRYTDAGVILRINLEKNHTRNITRISSVEYLPTWVYRGDGTKKQHIIFPSQMALTDSLLPDFLNESHRKKMAEAFEDTKAIITKYNSHIRLASPKK